MNYCAPSANTLERSYTCFTVNELQTIASSINFFIKKNKPICIEKNSDKCVLLTKKDIISISNDKLKLWNDIKNRLDKICPLEKCWVNTNLLNNIKDKNIRHQLKYFTIKPKMRELGNYWLSTSDINYVMNQYSKLHDSFLFLGAQPSDFYRIVNVPFDKFKKYNKIGIVFNHDTHSGSGSHWVSLLIDNISQTIEYYDSTGDSPVFGIKKFIKKLHHLYPKYKFIKNNNIHQQKDSECGVYSIYFLVQRLLGYSFESVVQNIIPDNQMNEYRNILFTR